MCVSVDLHEKVRHFKVGSISQYSDHRALSMSISTNPTRGFSENSAFLGIHDALKAFKWTRSVVISLDTSTRFRTAQEEPHHVDGIASLINQSVNITSEVVQLNQEVVTLYLDITSTITFTSRKSGRPQNKKKWFNLDCRAVKRVANGADRNADRNPHSLFLRGQHFLKRRNMVPSEYRRRENFSPI